MRHQRRPLWPAVGAITAVALALRLVPLALRAPWMDEVASAIFNLGNSSHSLPLNQLVNLDAFLKPLQGTPGLNPGGVVHNLLREDNHPPLYFLLAHGWQQLLQPAGGLANIGLSRLLPALLGVCAVPLSAAVGQVALGNRRGALLAGLWMAVSPLALAQSLEIRQYSLAIVLATASLLCFVQAWRQASAGRRLPLPWLLGWIAINSAGVACHYFFVFTVLMQAAAAALLMPRHRRCWLALGASLLGATVWLPVLRTVAGSGQTSWLQIDLSQPAWLLTIPLQALLGVLFNAVAPGTFAVHAWQWPFAIAAGLATLTGLVLLAGLVRRHLLRTGQRHEASVLFAVLVGCGLLVQIGASLVTLSDLTKGFRYSFFMVPAAIGLLASLCEAELAASAQHRNRGVKALLACALVCALGVDAGAVLPKWYAGDLLLERIARESNQQVLLAYDHNRVGVQPTVIGLEPLSLAWWIGSQPGLRRDLERSGKPMLFALAVDGPGLPGADRAAASNAIQALKTPIDLWVIGVPNPTLARPDCRLLARGSEGNHVFTHYRCSAVASP